MFPLPVHYRVYNCCIDFLANRSVATLWDLPALQSTFPSECLPAGVRCGDGSGCDKRPKLLRAPCDGLRRAEGEGRPCARRTVSIESLLASEHIRARRNPYSRGGVEHAAHCGDLISSRHLARPSLSFTRLLTPVCWQGNQISTLPFYPHSIIALVEHKIINKADDSHPAGTRTGGGLQRINPVAGRVSKS